MLPDDTGTRLQEVHALLMTGAGDEATLRIDSIVTEIKADGENAEASRLISAHLRSAQVLIERTHLAPAAESVEKAIYVVSHESQAGEPDPQLNV